MIDIFKDGDKQALVNILGNKEERENHKRTLLLDNQDKTLISVSFNIPGDIKNNVDITRGFGKAVKSLKDYLLINGMDISFQEQLSKPTGPEAYFMIVGKQGAEIKKICIKYEESKQIGRLLDIDVYQLNDEQLRLIDRATLQQAPRRCYICEKPAKECSRNKTHSIIELRAKVNEIFAELLCE